MIEDRADLPNAIALNSLMVNGSRILGPSVGGLLIAAVGEDDTVLVPVGQVRTQTSMSCALKIRT